MDLSLRLAPDGPSISGSILRSTQAYLELHAPKVTLEGGIAFCCPQWPDFRTGQQFREVLIESADEMQATYDEAEAHFAEEGLTCSRWALAEAQSPEMVEPVLFANGFERAERVALALTEWTEPIESESLRILPARPMRAAYETCWQSATSFLPELEQAATVEAALERLDDHRMDAFVAMRDGKPAGIGALFQVGDIARVIDFYVLSDHRRQGVASAMLSHAIAMARRLTMRVVCTEVATDNAGGLAFLEARKFIRTGSMIEYFRSDVVRPDYALW